MYLILFPVSTGTGDVRHLGKGKQPKNASTLHSFSPFFFILSPLSFILSFRSSFFSPICHSLIMQLCHDQSLSFRNVSVSEEKEMVLRLSPAHAYFTLYKNLACGKHLTHTRTKVNSVSVTLRPNRSHTSQSISQSLSSCISNMFRLVVVFAAFSIFRQKSLNI